uniref:Sushi domain-containing protein n=1 Tax=Sphaeramia orbicularis TaxID=375764 RepID=A0A673AWX4_9TELE
MDSGSLPVRWCVKPSFIMVCLLWTVRCSYGDKNNCPCPEIPHLELTEPPTRGCYNISNTFRYKCIDGYVRKAGTSNLVKCKEDQGSVAWTTPKLACIPDPQRITTPSNTPETEDSVWKTGDTKQTPTSTTTEPVNNGTDSEFSDSRNTGLDVTKTVVICASVVIVCALIGISLWCYRRRRTNIPPQTDYQMEEEMSPMSCGSCEETE